MLPLHNFVLWTWVRCTILCTRLFCAFAFLWTYLIIVSGLPLRILCDVAFAAELNILVLDSATEEDRYYDKIVSSSNHLNNIEIKINLWDICQGHPCFARRMTSNLSPSLGAQPRWGVGLSINRKCATNLWQQWGNSAKKTPWFCWATWFSDCKSYRTLRVAEFCASLGQGLMIPGKAPGMKSWRTLPLFKSNMLKRTPDD